MKCSDCGIEMTEQEIAHHDSRWPEITTFTNGESRPTPEHLVGKLQIPEHLNKCCDCTDEAFGMHPNNRSKPRPEK